MRLLLFSLLILFSACQPSERPSPTQSRLTEIPRLLDRPESTRHGQEWDQVQNRYTQYRDQILSEKEADKALLQLAQLFTVEARVTGEHGHYYPAALQTLDALLDSAPDDRDLTFLALTTKAGVLLSQHQFAAALETGKEALEMNPYNAQIYGVLVDAQVELGHYEKAVELADQMVAIRPDLRSYARVSYLREIHGLVDPAIEAMQLAVSAGLPGSEEAAWTRLQLGQLYERYGQPQKAEAHFLHVLTERPAYPFALGALGRLELERGDYAKAEKWLTQAAEAIPELSFYEDLVRLYQATGRNAEAEKTLNAVLLMMQDDVASGHQMNLEFARVCAELMHDDRRALEYLLREYDQRPDNIDVNRELAGLYTRMGQTGEAQFHLRKAARTNSRHPELVSLQSEMGVDRLSAN